MGVLLRSIIQTLKILLYVTGVYFFVRNINYNYFKETAFRLLECLNKSILFVSIGGIVVFLMSMVIGVDVLPLERTTPLFSPGFYTISPLVGTPLFRAHFLGEPKGLAAWAVIGFLTSLYLLETEHNRNYKKTIYRTLIFIIIVFLTFSRGGFIALFSVVLCYFIYKIVSLKKIKVKYIVLLLIIVFSIPLMYVLSMDLQTGLLNTLQASENIENTLLEDYDYAVVQFYRANPSNSFLPVGLAFLEASSRQYLPASSPWTFESNYSIRRGFVLSIIQYGLLGSSIIALLLISFSMILVRKRTYSGLFLLITWFVYFLQQVEAGTISFHVLMFAILYMITFQATAPDATKFPSN